MAKEFVAKAYALRSSLDQTWDICDDKSAILSIHNSKIRAKSCEVIVGNLWLCICDTGKKGGFTYIRKTYQSNVSDHLKLQKNFKLLERLTWLCIFGNLHSWSGIVLVSLAAASAAQNDLTTIVAGHICNNLAGSCVHDHSTFRYL